MSKVLYETYLYGFGIRVVRNDDNIVIEQQSTDALGKKIWISIARPKFEPQRSGWDALKDALIENTHGHQ